MFNALVEDWVTEALGISYRQLVVERRIGLPTVRLEVDFQAVSRMGDKVLLALEVERLGRRSITLLLRCTGADGAAAHVDAPGAGHDLARHARVDRHPRRPARRDRARHRPPPN